MNILITGAASTLAKEIIAILGESHSLRLMDEAAVEYDQDEDVVDPDDAICEVVGQNAQAMVVRFMARSSDPKCGWKMHCRLRERMLAVAAGLDAAASNEPAPAFLPREREVRMDLAGKDESE